MKLCYRLYQIKFKTKNGNIIFYIHFHFFKYTPSLWYTTTTTSHPITSTYHMPKLAKRGYILFGPFKLAIISSFFNPLSTNPTKCNSRQIV